MTPKILAGAMLAAASISAPTAYAAPLPSAAITTNTTQPALTVSPSAKAVILAQYTASKKVATSKNLKSQQGANFVDTNSGGFKDRPGFADFRKPSGDLKNKKINIQKNLKNIR